MHIIHKHAGVYGVYENTKIEMDTPNIPFDAPTNFRAERVISIRYANSSHWCTQKIVEVTRSNFSFFK